MATLMKGINQLKRISLSKGYSLMQRLQAFFVSTRQNRLE